MVTLYSDPQWKGRWKATIYEGDYDSKDLPSHNITGSDVSSLEVAVGYKVTLCKEAGFSGEKVTYTGPLRVPFIGFKLNDHVQSVQVETISTPQKKGAYGENAASPEQQKIGDCPRDYASTQILFDGKHMETNLPFKLPPRPQIKRVDDRPYKLDEDPKGVNFNFQTDVNYLEAFIVPHCVDKDGHPVVAKTKEYKGIDPCAFCICERVDKKDHKVKIIMVDELGGRGLFVPAGKIEPGETVSAAIIREGVEETGVLFKPLGLFDIVLGGASYAKSYDETLPMHFCVACAQASKTLKSSQDSESCGAGWFDLEEVVADVSDTEERPHPTKPQRFEYFGKNTGRKYRKPWEICGILKSYIAFKEKYPNNTWIPLGSADPCHFNIHPSIDTLYD